MTQQVTNGANKRLAVAYEKGLTPAFILFEGGVAAHASRGNFALWFRGAQFLLAVLRLFDVLKMFLIFFVINIFNEFAFKTISGGRSGCLGDRQNLDGQ